jgi:hypothetical protein
MKRGLSAIFMALAFSGLIVLTGWAQSGGSFSITQSVIAGGGQNSSGGAFALNGTIGQPVAGVTSSGGVFSQSGGFWISDLSPTAAGVNISGRVITPEEKGLFGAIVTLTDQAGNIRTTRTATFGYYQFTDIEVGQTVILTVISKKYIFQPQVVFVSDEISGLDFYPSGYNRAGR